MAAQQHQPQTLVADPGGVDDPRELLRRGRFAVCVDGEFTRRTGQPPVLDGPSAQSIDELVARNGVEPGGRIVRDA